MNSLGHNELIIYQGSGSTHLPLVPHICVSESGQHRFRWWLVAYSVSIHYLKYCGVIVNCIHRNRFHWNFIQNSDVFIYEIAFENVICEMANIFSMRRWVKGVLSTNWRYLGHILGQKGRKALFYHNTPIQHSIYHMNIDWLVGIKVFITVQTHIIIITHNACHYIKAWTHSYHTNICVYDNHVSSGIGNDK